MTVARYAICNASTGEILRLVTCTADQVSLQVGANEEAIEAAAGELDTTHYAVAGALVLRPTLGGFDQTAIVADDVDVASITDLPDPCTVAVDGVEHEVTGGTLSISSPMPATYTVRIDCFPYLLFEEEIVAS